MHGTADDEVALRLLGRLARAVEDRDDLDGEAARRAVVAEALAGFDAAEQARLRPALARLLADPEVALDEVVPTTLHGDEVRALLALAVAGEWPPPWQPPAPAPRPRRAEPVPVRCPACGGPLDRRRTTAVAPPWVEARCARDGFHDAWGDPDEDEPTWWSVPAGRHRIGLDDLEVARLEAARADHDDDALHGLRRPALVAADAARPAHAVDLGAFEIQARPVTRAEYAAFAAATGRPLPDGPDDAPVLGVTWTDAARCALWLGGALPTEAQWERFARGAAGHLFAPALDPAAPLEWCWDWYGPYPGPAETGGAKARRGGASMGAPPCPALRDRASPSWPNVATTFRCVRPGIRAVALRRQTFGADDDWLAWLRDCAARAYAHPELRDDLDVAPAVQELAWHFEGTELSRAIAAAACALVERGTAAEVAIARPLADRTLLARAG